MSKFKYVFLLFLTLIFVQNVTNAETHIFKEEHARGTYLGIKYDNGKILLKPVYKDIIKDADGYILIPHPKYKTVYNLQGKKVFEIKDGYVSNYLDNYIILQSNEGYYIADLEGKKLSEKYYDFIIPDIVDDRFALAFSDKNNYDVLNQKGKIIISQDEVQTFFVSGDGNIIFKDKKEDKIFTVNYNGNREEILEEEFSKLYEAAEKEKADNHFYMAFSGISSNRVKYGILDGDIEIIEPKYDEVSITAGNPKYFCYKENGLWGVKDFNENTILKPQLEKYIIIPKNNILEKSTPDYIYMDNYFNKLFELNGVTLVDGFKSGLAIVAKVVDGSLRYGYINKTGKVVIDFKYDYAYNFSEDLAVVVRIIDGKKKYGYIDKQGNLKIDFIYDFAFRFDEGRARVRLDKEQFYIDRTGKILKKIK